MACSSLYAGRQKKYDRPVYIHIVNLSCYQKKRLYSACSEYWSRDAEFAHITNQCLYRMQASNYLVG